MSDWAGFLDLATPFGVVDVRAGAGFGLDETAVRRRARNECWPAPYPRVRLVPGRTIDDPLTRLAAALISVGYPSFAAKESALWLHGVLPDADAPRRPQLVLPHGLRYRQKRRDDLEVVRTRILPVAHVTDVRDLRATTIARALVDLAAAGASRARIRGLAIRARRLGAVDIAAELTAVSGAFAGGRTGLRVVAQVVADLAGDGADSAPEFRWRGLLRAGKVDVWPAPFPWRCPDGVNVHLDVAIPGAWVALEHDGPAHEGPDAFRIDRRRWNQIGREWSVVHATDEDLASPARVLAEVRARVADADPARPPATPASCGCPVCARPAGASAFG